MKTNLTLLLLLGCIGMVTITGMQGELVTPAQEAPPAQSTAGLNMSDGVTTGVRYVYIQFPGDTTRVVKLQELNTVINDRVVEYTDVSDSEVTDD